MTVFWPALIAGVVLLVVGVLILRNSSSLAAWLKSVNGRVPGRGRDDPRYTSGNAKAAGIGALVIGALGVVLSLLDLDW